jgi:hypothetical protein
MAGSAGTSASARTAYGLRWLRATNVIRVTGRRHRSA